MPIPFVGGRDQTEIIRRGERTEPTIIVKQAWWGALVSSGVVFCILALILVSAAPPWKWYAGNWRWMCVLVFAPWPFWAAFAAIQLFIEVFDPNHPPPRRALETNKAVMPWDERKEPPQYRERKPDYLIFDEKGKD